MPTKVGPVVDGHLHRSDGFGMKWDISKTLRRSNVRATKKEVTLYGLTSLQEMAESQQISSACHLVTPADCLYAVFRGESRGGWFRNQHSQEVDVEATTSHVLSATVE